MPPSPDYVNQCNVIAKKENMEQSTRDKISKVYALATQGATDGERQAAKTQLDRLLKKHNLENIDQVLQKEYLFTYATELDKKLFLRILICFIPAPHRYVHWYSQARKYGVNLHYEDYVTVSCAYEYFRRHMAAEWKRIALPEVNRCRTAKTKKKRRDELQQSFYQQYCLKSKLYLPCELETRSADSMTRQQIEDINKMSAVEAGSYKTQIQSAHLLNSPK